MREREYGRERRGQRERGWSETSINTVITQFTKMVTGKYLVMVVNIQHESIRASVESFTWTKVVHKGHLQ